MIFVNLLLVLYQFTPTLDFLKGLSIARQNVFTNQWINILLTNYIDNLLNNCCNFHVIKWWAWIGTRAWTGLAPLIKAVHQLCYAFNHLVNIYKIMPMKSSRLNFGISAHERINFHNWIISPSAAYFPKFILHKIHVVSTY